jgi:hypothetical protein
MKKEDNTKQDQAPDSYSEDDFLSDLGKVCSKVNKADKTDKA